MQASRTGFLAELREGREGRTRAGSEDKREREACDGFFGEVKNPIPRLWQGFFNSPWSVPPLL